MIFQIKYFWLFNLKYFSSPPNSKYFPSPQSLCPSMQWLVPVMGNTRGGRSTRCLHINSVLENNWAKQNSKYRSFLLSLDCGGKTSYSIHRQWYQCLSWGYEIPHGLSTKHTFGKGKEANRHFSHLFLREFVNAQKVRQYYGNLSKIQCQTIKFNKWWEIFQKFRKKSSQNSWFDEPHRIPDTFSSAPFDPTKMVGNFHITSWILQNYWTNRH